MPVAVNGRLLGVERNGEFSDATTDPIPGGRLWPEAAAAWNAMRAAAILDGILPQQFMPAGPVSSARPRSAQDYFWRHQPPAAAPPYTSNHGWAIAVDVGTRRAAAWMLANAHRFGWSWDEGRRVGEWWHWRYVGGFTPRRRDGLAHLTAIERRRCRELDKLRRERRDTARQKVLTTALTEQRQAIWREAQRTGWDRANRRRRYRSLLARTI